ncbi:MAG: cysteine--tRNA ligase [Alphaproteobacteria bacterium]|nr:cysteine--tRNA ligase [Alphaproteobacteria bacterium]
MKLKLYNTLSGKIEEFKPIDPNHVKMYVCGPTVYDRPHIGNARSAVIFDLLYRVLKYLYPKVTYVRNITDIDDKIYKAAKERSISIEQLTNENIKIYHEDMRALNLLDPDIEPRATDHIPDIIEYIENLIEHKKAYVSNNHVYFDISQYEQYGRLSKKKIGDLISGARVQVSENKKSPLDFVLWKPADENFDYGWDSPWGRGRPGWHIECSVMASKYLGRTFDIHGGGIDLVFPHHENEIAQSCAINPCEPMANYWIHNGHLNVNGKKMSKSLGNFYTVRDLLDKYDGDVIRLCLLMTHYSSPMNFSFDTLNAARSIMKKWKRKYDGIDVFDFYKNKNFVSCSSFIGALLNNLNSPLFVSLV